MTEGSCLGCVCVCVEEGGGGGGVHAGLVIGPHWFLMANTCASVLYEVDYKYV